MSPLLRELLSLAIVVGLMGYCYWLGRERHAHRLRKAEAEVERLTAEGVAASERRDYFKARCEQQERDHAETVAEVERVRELHKKFVCGCGADHGIGCHACGSTEYPCRTIRALDGGAS